MIAEILIKDKNVSSCLIEVRFGRLSFDGWSSYAKPIGPSNSGNCSRFGVLDLHLTDKNSNLLNLSWSNFILSPDLMFLPGNSGKGFVKSNGFLTTGGITWEVWNTRSTDDTGDDWVEKNLKFPSGK
jgi:hypothetical protein